jgi:hypothetical protein
MADVDSNLEIAAFVHLGYRTGSHQVVSTALQGILAPWLPCPVRPRMAHYYNFLLSGDFFLDSGTLLP